MDNNSYAKYSVCNVKSSNRLTHWFLNHFYHMHTIEKNINGTRYICEYHRSPFWAYEKPTIKLFVKSKLCTWHGQVWEVFPRGGRCGFGSNCISALFPKKRMQKFLDTESKFVWNACNGDK